MSVSSVLLARDPDATLCVHDATADRLLLCIPHQHIRRTVAR